MPKFKCIKRMYNYSALLNKVMTYICNCYPVCSTLSVIYSLKSSVCDLIPGSV